MNNLLKMVMLLIGSVGAFVCLSSGAYAVTGNLNLGNATAMYEATLVFETQSDYTTFKYFLSRDEVVLQSFDEVSASLPIVARYKMEAPKPLPNPYSKPTGFYGEPLSVAFIAFNFGLGAICLGAAVFAGIDVFRMIRNKVKQNKNAGGLKNGTSGSIPV